MAKINQNLLAKDIAEDEGLKIELSIGQVKEVLRITLDKLAEEYQASEILELLERHGL